MNNIKIIEEMVGNGFCARKIAIILNMKHKEIQKIIRDNNFTIIKETFDISKLEHIMNLYDQKVSAKNLGIKYRVSKSMIKKEADKRGVFRNKFQAGRIHNVNENIFDIIDTEEKAYWLGFLYADVYNSEDNGSITLRLATKDQDHVEKFCNFMSYDIKQITIREHISKKGNKTYSAGVCINSQHLSRQLASLGCMQAKSNIITYPQWLNPKLNIPFIRGIFDGDGSIKFSKKYKEYSFKLAGTKELLQNIEHILKKYNNVNFQWRYISKNNKNTWELSSNGNLQVQKTLDSLYKNTNIYLTRKYNRYQDLLALNKLRHPKLFASVNFSDILTINHLGPDISLDKKYLSQLSLEERAKLVPFIVDRIINLGFIYPNDFDINRDYKKITEKEINLGSNIISNHLILGINICKYFCPSYFNTHTREDCSMSEMFKNVDIITKLVSNKLGLNDKKLENLNFSYQTLIYNAKKSYLCAQTSIFKPTIAKYMCLKYSQPGDVVGDYSVGFGGRLLGAISCGRKYIGTDPLTAPEVQNMIDYFKFNDCKVI